jgi:hypothetical protein
MAKLRCLAGCGGVHGDKVEFSRLQRLHEGAFKAIFWRLLRYMVIISRQPYCGCADWWVSKGIVPYFSNPED